LTLSSPAVFRTDSLPRSTADVVRFDPYAPALGATVRGIDLSKPVSPELATSLRRGLLAHGVLFFRDQTLEPARFLEVASIFGEPLRHNPYLPSLVETSGVEIIESGTSGQLANEAWHSDVTWQRNPPKATALYAAELPALGGDTVWTSSTGAYRSLPPALAAYLETLTAVNFVDANGYPRADESEEREQRLAELRAKYPPIDVPVIETHPETAEKSIFVTELHTTYIKGLTRVASESLLRLLFGALENAELHARFRWERGSVAIWDNRLVQHRAVHDYGAQRRVLHRITLA
jgi:taurine dioxygenase